MSFSNIFLLILPFIFLFAAIDANENISVNFKVGSGFLVDDIVLQNGQQIGQGNLLKKESRNGHLFGEKIFTFEEIDANQYFILRFKIYDEEIGFQEEEKVLFLTNVKKSIYVFVNLHGKKAINISGAIRVLSPEPTLAKKLLNYGAEYAKHGLNYSANLAGTAAKQIYNGMNKENANKALGLAKQSFNYIQKGAESLNKFRLNLQAERRQNIGLKEGMILVNFAIGHGYNLGEEIGLKCCGKKAERKVNEIIEGGQEEGLKNEEAKFILPNEENGQKCTQKCELTFAVINAENGHKEIYSSEIFSRDVLISVYVNGEQEDGVYLEDSKPTKDGDENSSMEYIKQNLEPKEEINVLEKQIVKAHSNAVDENIGHQTHLKEIVKVEAENVVQNPLNQLKKIGNDFAIKSNKIRVEFTLANGIFWHQLGLIKMKCADENVNEGQWKQWKKGILHKEGNGNEEKLIAIFEFEQFNNEKEEKCQNYRLLIKTEFHKNIIQHDVNLKGISRMGLAINFSANGKMTIQGATSHHIVVYKLEIKIVFKLAIGYKSDWVHLECIDGQNILKGNQLEEEVKMDVNEASNLVALFGFEKEQCKNYRLIVKTKLRGEVKKYEAELANISNNELAISVEGEGKFTVAGAKIAKQEYQIFITYLYNKKYELGEIGLVCEEKVGENMKFTVNGQPREVKDGENESRETDDENVEGTGLGKIRTVFTFKNGLCKQYGLQFMSKSKFDGKRKFFTSRLSQIEKTVVIKLDPETIKPEEYTLVGGIEERLKANPREKLLQYFKSEDYYH